jgi:nucleotide-binding universal stress UspA family protein
MLKYCDHDMSCSMQMYKKILIGVDGSEASIRAAEKAALLQKDCGCEIILFHAVKHRMPPPKLPLLFPLVLSNQTQEYKIPEDDYLKIQKQYEEAGKKILAEISKKMKGLNAKVEAKLVLDIEPAEYAIEMATKQGVDLVVVGCKGHHSKLKEIVIGTVAEKILNKVPCDVLIIR